MLRPFIALLLTAVTLTAAESVSTLYEQKVDVVFGEVDGAGLLMDVFVPKTKKNGLAIIDVASGAFYSDRSKIRDHQTAQLYNIFCGRGYTVFAIRPGSRPRFTLLDMEKHVKHGVRFIKSRASEYGIDPDRLGLTGASAGGNIASLVALAPDAGDEKSKQPINTFDTSIKAVAVFFPPTDFLEWGGKRADLNRVADLLFIGGIQGRAETEVEAAAKAVSPAYRVGQVKAPFLVIHGDADPVVPLEQSEKLVKKIQDAGGKAELIIKKGGGHPWFTIFEEVKVMADWFDKNL